MPTKKELEEIIYELKIEVVSLKDINAATGAEVVRVKRTCDSLKNDRQTMSDNMGVARKVREGLKKEIEELKLDVKYLEDQYATSMQAMADVLHNLGNFK